MPVRKMPKKLVLRQLIRQREKPEKLHGFSMAVVETGNIKELMNCANIDGALVGGASLKVDSF